MSSAPITAGGCYLHVFLESLYVGDVRRGLARFYGVVSSMVALPAAGGGTAQTMVVATPKGLENADAEHLDHAIVDTTRLFGLVPYVGHI